jgi:hypothetical protein
MSIGMTLEQYRAFLNDLWNEANFGEDDGAMDLGGRLIEIQNTLENEMNRFNWKPELSDGY